MWEDNGMVELICLFLLGLNMASNTWTALFLMFRHNTLHILTL